MVATALVAARHGRSVALLTDAGFTLVALSIAVLAIRPAGSAPPVIAEELAQEIVSLLISE